MMATLPEMFEASQDSATHRVCGACGESKTFDNFNKDGKDSNGNNKYRRDCKDCYKVSRIRESKLKTKKGAKK